MSLDEALQDYNARCPENLATVSAGRDGISVSPSGSFDLGSSHALLDLLSRMIEAAEPGSKFRVELTRVSYLPSTAIGALSTALVQAKRKNIAFSVREVPEPL